MAKELNQNILAGDYETAANIIENCNPETMDATDCILAATVYQILGKDTKSLDFIEKGLSIDPINYELYLMLGNYYAKSNPDLAFLCYENAEYYCTKACGRDSGDYRTIHETMLSLCDGSQLSVHPASIVILSYNTLEVTKLCINSIRSQCNPDAYELIVIDNASSDGSAEWLAEQSDLIFIANSKNAGFPVGCNQGIQAAAPENDIFLLNNDTIVMQNSLFTLRMGLYASEKIGAAGSVTNYAGNYQMVPEKFAAASDSVAYACKCNVPGRNMLEFKSWLVGFALLIKRGALDCAGLLDPLYTPGNYEDNDICVRIGKAGYSMVLCHNSFIYHWGSVSFKSLGLNQFADVSTVNMEKFIGKWGFQPHYYDLTRTDVLALMHNARTCGLHILDVGCGAGATLARAKYLYPNSHVCGVELLPEIAAMADVSLHVICGDIETMDFPYEAGSFDYILCCDVLDELKNPDAVLEKLIPYLKPDGFILASIPNLMNADVIFRLLQGHFPYETEGIRRRSAIHFYTCSEICRLFEDAGLSITQIISSMHPKYTTEAVDKPFFDRLLAMDGVADKVHFDTYRYLIKAQINRDKP